MREVLATPGATRYILEKYGIRARKKYGQNFLIDANVIRGIIDAAQITQDDCVLEIGPGIGSMTQLLSGAAGKVICVEIDESRGRCWRRRWKTAIMSKYCGRIF